MSRFSRELEENKRLPGWYPVSMHGASLSAEIQMSCVASAATSRCRRRRRRSGLTPAAPSSPTPSSPSSSAPSGRPRPSLATVTQRHSRLPLPAPGSLPACQPPSPPSPPHTPRVTCEPLRTLQKTGDSSDLVWLPLQLIVSQLPSDGKKKPPTKPGI